MILNFVKKFQLAFTIFSKTEIMNRNWLRVKLLHIIYFAIYPAFIYPHKSIYLDTKPSHIMNKYRRQQQYHYKYFKDSLPIVVATQPIRIIKQNKQRAK